MIPEFLTNMLKENFYEHLLTNALNGGSFTTDDVIVIVNTQCHIINQ